MTPESQLALIQAENALPVPARRIDERGRCCGRKPLHYKLPAPRWFCARCDRQYGANGWQQANWCWRRWDDDHFVMSETSQRAAANDAARRLGLPFPFGMPADPDEKERIR